MLRKFKKQSIDFSKQLIELVWQQSQQKSNSFKSFSKSLSVKQPIETTIQQVDFPLLFENTSFSKGLKTNSFGSLWVDYKFKLPKTHTHKQQQSLQPSSWIWSNKSLSSTISPYLMKTNPWFSCVVLFEFESTCKTTIVHVPDSNKTQV